MFSDSSVIEQRFISKFQKAIKPMWIQLFTYIMANIDSVDIEARQRIERTKSSR